jgi:hypothetical protein
MIVYDRVFTMCKRLYVYGTSVCNPLGSYVVCAPSQWCSYLNSDLGRLRKLILFDWWFYGAMSRSSHNLTDRVIIRYCQITCLILSKKQNNAKYKYTRTHVKWIRNLLLAVDVRYSGTISRPIRPRPSMRHLCRGIRVSTWCESSNIGVGFHLRQFEPIFQPTLQLSFLVNTKNDWHLCSWKWKSTLSNAPKDVHCATA